MVAIFITNPTRMIIPVGALMSQVQFSAGGEGRTGEEERGGLLTGRASYSGLVKAPDDALNTKLHGGGSVANDDTFFSS